MYLLPKPKTIKEQDGQMLLCHSTHIVMTKEVAETEMHAAKRLQEAIRQETGLILPFSVGEVREGDLSLGIAKTLPEQTYEITIDEKGGQISGGDGAGVLYGVETFCQIVQQCGGILPCVQIQDAPDMPNRGYYFDQTRGRVLKLEELKKIIEIKPTIKDYNVDEKYFLETLDEMSEQAFNDKCTGANPRYPLIAELKEIYLKAYYGK